MFITFEFLVKSHAVERITVVVSTVKEAISFASFLQFSDKVSAFKMSPITLSDLGLSADNVTKYRSSRFTKNDYDDNTKLLLPEKKDASAEQKYPEDYVTCDGFTFSSMWSPSKLYKIWRCPDRKLSVLVNYVEDKDGVSSIWHVNTETTPHPVIGRIKRNPETGKYSFRLDKISDSVEYFEASTPEACEHEMMKTLTHHRNVHKLEHFWFYDIEIT